MNDVMWLGYACLAVVSVFAVPAAIACVVDALFKAHEQPMPAPE
jgi:hypothetical protein